MRHDSSLNVLTHWNERRGNDVAPSRPDIDPGAIRHSLGDVFLLSADFSGIYRYRLAGTRICALLGRELKDTNFADMWAERDRLRLNELLRTVSDDHTGAIAGVTATTDDGSSCAVELLVLPLLHRGHARIRAMGVLAPHNVPYWLGVKPVTSMALGSVRYLDVTATKGGLPTYRAADGGRVMGDLVVHDGGQGRPSHAEPEEKAS